MFAMKNTGENSGETYKVSFNVGAYIFALLKVLRLVFLMRHFAKLKSVAQTNFLSIYKTFTSHLLTLKLALSSYIQHKHGYDL